MGIEPMTIRLRSACSANCAKEALESEEGQPQGCAFGKGSAPSPPPPGKTSALRQTFIFFAVAGAHASDVDHGNAGSVLRDRNRCHAMDARAHTNVAVAREITAAGCVWRPSANRFAKGRPAASP